MSSDKNQPSDAQRAIINSGPALAEHWRRAISDVTPANRFIWLSLLSLLVFSVLGFITYRAVANQFQEVSNERMRVIHSRNVLGELTNVRDLLQQGATAVRLYVESSSDDFLAPINTMQQGYAQQLQGLQRLLQTQEEQRNFQQLKLLTDVVFNQAENWFQIYQRDGAKAAQSNQALAQSVRVSVVAMRVFTTSWRDRELATLANSDQRAIRQLAQAQRYALGALLIGGGFILALGLLLRAYMLRRQQMEANLRVASTLWSNTLESLDQGVGLYTMDGRLMLWNSRFPEIYGLPPNTLYPGIGAAEIVRESKRLEDTTVEQDIADAYETAELARAGKVMLRERQQCDGRIVQILGRQMDNNYYVITLTDITAMRVSERLSRERATRLTAIMDNVPDAIVTLNASGSVESWSAGAARMFGYDSDEILRRHANLLFVEPFAGAQDGYLQRCLNGNEVNLAGQRVELDARRKDGSVFPIDLSISEMHIDGRRILVCIVRDISERRAVERLKSEFVATVSHELRTPLTSIAGSLALLANDLCGALPDKSQRLLDIANRNSQRLTVLINDILELEKAESGKLSLQLQAQALLPVIEQAIEANRSYAQRLQVRFVLRADGSDSMVLLDELRFMQIMANLLSNAVKFSPPGAEVLITVAQNNEVVRITVHDGGPGIAESFKSRVFTRFAQADSSNTRRNGGTGLGLAITKSLVEHHGGNIGFDSGQSLVGAGLGASFWFQLPLLPAGSATLPAPSAVSLAGVRILVCDDDPDIAELLSKLLQQYGGIVEVAYSAGAAQQVMLQQPADVLLVDMNLPDSDGLTLIAELRAQANLQNMPVVILSAIDCAALDPEMLRSLGVTSCLRKPVDALALIRTLMQMLELRI